MDAKRKRLCLALALVFALNIFIICFAQYAEALILKKGSTGSTVSRLQTLLKEQGFYSGAVDGVYGSATEAAVKKYQKRYGLKVDGMAGPETLGYLGINAQSGGTSGGGNVDLLARLISAEARGEPYVGQVAVGAVVLNRMEHPSFPNTMSGVIYQPGAFSCIDDGQFNEPVAESSYRAARDALNGWDPSGGAIYYFNPVTATSKWIWSRPLITVIGRHRFCA